MHVCTDRTTHAFTCMHLLTERHLHQGLIQEFRAGGNISVSRAISYTLLPISESSTLKSMKV